MHFYTHIERGRERAGESGRDTDEEREGERVCESSIVACSTLCHVSPHSHHVVENLFSLPPQAATECPEQIVAEAVEEARRRSISSGNIS